MEIGFCRSKEEWDDFLIRKDGSFLQSYDWGEFKKNYQRIWRIEGRKEGELVAVAQVFAEKALSFNYLYIPHGPVAEKREERELIFHAIKKEIGKGYDFLKVEPREDILLGAPSYYRIQPGKTIVFDLEKGDILPRLGKNTRYNIRLAKRKGVEVKKEKNIEAFYKLLLKTKKRQEFSIYPKNYLEKILKMKSSCLFLGSYGEEIITGGIMYFFGNTATCLHSASDHSFRKVKAANLLRYEMMEYSKREGFRWFDSWGIDEKRFPGVTKFKRGFGGEEIDYPSGRELPVNRVKYSIYRALSFIKEKSK